MCGIVGIVAHRGSVSPELLQATTDSLAHRGPDDSGTVILRETSSGPAEIGLGNRRLAVLDISPLGHQPMQDAETGNWIVYNGEVYNFRELRRRLESEGSRFCGQSDTEVVLKAYGRWGRSCLNDLRGIFAFAIWDARRHRLFLARDGMGVKPLYYASSGNCFAFASEIRALLKTGLVRRTLDRAGLLNYLAFGSAYDPVTLVEGVSALRAGHFLCWEQGEIREQTYWDLAGDDSCEAKSSSDDRARQEEELQDCIRESVRMQTISDVPVGVFLSGGIDSSAIAAVLKRAGTNISTFSVVLQEASYSEGKYSRAVAATLGTDHHEILISAQESQAALPFAVQAMDQPTMDGVNTFLLSQKVRAAGIKVALSGLGGDELFAGYANFRTIPRMERFMYFWRQVPYAAHSSAATILECLTPASDRNRKIAALIGSNGDLLHPYFVARALFTPKLRNRLCWFDPATEQPRADACLVDCLARTAGMDAINRISYLESRAYMLNTLLRDADAMSMAHGLELRVPLLDPVLARTVFALPGAWKVDRHTPKQLLVQATQGALPDEIVHRRKRGFTLPFEQWLREGMRSEVEQTLNQVEHGPLAELLDADSVRQVWKDFLKRRISWSRPWALFVLQRWCELHGVTA